MDSYVRELIAQLTDSLGILREDVRLLEQEVRHQKSDPPRPTERGRNRYRLPLAILFIALVVFAFFLGRLTVDDNKKELEEEREVTRELLKSRGTLIDEAVAKAKRDTHEHYAQRYKAEKANSAEFTEKTWREYKGWFQP